MVNIMINRKKAVITATNVIQGNIQESHSTFLYEINVQELVGRTLIKKLGNFPCL